jgi:hypothetical protein
VKKFQWCFLLILVFTVTISSQSWWDVGNAGFSPGGVGYPAMAIDSIGTPYVVFKDFVHSGKATVMKYNGVMWEIVGASGFSAGEVEFTSIAIDRSGNPYVVYMDAANSNKATVNRFNGISWEIVGTAGFSNGIAFYTSIAMDKNSIPFVGFVDYGNSRKATVMRFNGVNWDAVGSAGFTDGIVDKTSITLDQNGFPFIVFIDVANSQKATVMFYDALNWRTLGNAGFSDEPIDYPSIFIDGNGVTYIAYAEGVSEKKATVKLHNGMWLDLGSPRFSEGYIRYTSIAVSNNGTPYIAFWEGDYFTYKGRALIFNGGSWEYLGSSDSVFSSTQAEYTNIVISPSGIPVVSYKDVYNSNRITVKQFSANQGDPLPVKENFSAPTDFILMQNYPNPFNPSTTIRFTIPLDEKRETGNVTLKVYDVIGNEIVTLVNEEKSAGSYEIEFNPASSIKNLPAGRQGPASGIYFYQLKAGDYLETKKMIYLK